jgi:hypothetical protein
MGRPRPENGPNHHKKDEEKEEEKGEEVEEEGEPIRAYMYDYAQYPSSLSRNSEAFPCE